MHSVLCSKADIMERKHRELLISERVFLVENLDMPLLFDHMIAKRLLNEDDKETLEVRKFCV